MGPNALPDTELLRSESVGQGGSHDECGEFDPQYAIGETGGVPTVRLDSTGRPDPWARTGPSRTLRVPVGLP